MVSAAGAIMHCVNALPIIIRPIPGSDSNVQALAKPNSRSCAFAVRSILGSDSRGRAIYRVHCSTCSSPPPSYTTGNKYDDPDIVNGSVPSASCNTGSGLSQIPLPAPATGILGWKACMPGLDLDMQLSMVPSRSNQNDLTM